MNSVVQHHVATLQATTALRVHTVPRTRRAPLSSRSVVGGVVVRSSAPSISHYTTDRQETVGPRQLLLPPPPLSLSSDRSYGQHQPTEREKGETTTTTQLLLLFMTG